MEHNDTGNLEAMKRLARSPIPRGMSLAELADQLLKKRDALAFVDNDWYHALTQHIVTLDSAATFEPQNEADNRQLESAINVAIDEILKLIGEKLM